MTDRWYYDNAGRPYYVDANGRSVYVANRQETGSEASGSQPLTTYPSVAMGQYQPYLRAPNSYPPRNQPSYELQKLTGHNLPYFGDGSQQSGRPNVDNPAASYDIYRDAKHAWGKEGLPNSQYDREYYEYKTADETANAAVERYLQYVDEAPEVTKEQREANLAWYGGRPLQTYAWHQQAAMLADDAVRAINAIVIRRANYDQDYIAYHDARYRPGHMEQVENMNRRLAKYQGFATRHRKWESLEGKIARGRAA